MKNKYNAYKWCLAGIIYNNENTKCPIIENWLNYVNIHPPEFQFENT